MNLLQVLNEIHRALGEIRHELGTIQGELVEIRRLSYRVGHWCHVAFAPPGQIARHELLTIRNAATGAELGLRNV